MKTSRILFRTIISVVLMISILSIHSCKEYPCENIVCQNGGACEEGICDCRIGFLGEFCEEYDTTKIPALLYYGVTLQELLDYGVKPSQLYGIEYEAGEIFFLDTLQRFGMLVATDISIGGEWGCLGTDLPGVSGTAFGTGMQNTQDFYENCPDNGPFKQAQELVHKGYDDWFVPSKDELYVLWRNLYANHNISNMGSSTIWSSSEHDSVNAWAINITTGEFSIIIKYYNGPSRAVRIFNY